LGYPCAIGFTPPSYRYRPPYGFELPSLGCAVPLLPGSRSFSFPLHTFLCVLHSRFPVTSGSFFPSPKFYSPVVHAWVGLPLWFTYTFPCLALRGTRLRRFAHPYPRGLCLPVYDPAPHTGSAIVLDFAPAARLFCATPFLLFSPLHCLHHMPTVPYGSGCVYGSCVLPGHYRIRLPSYRSFGHPHLPPHTLPVWFTTRMTPHTPHLPPLFCAGATPRSGSRTRAFLLLPHTTHVTLFRTVLPHTPQRVWFALPTFPPLRTRTLYTGCRYIFVAVLTPFTLPIPSGRTRRDVAVGAGYPATPRWLGLLRATTHPTITVLCHHCLCLLFFHYPLLFELH